MAYNLFKLIARILKFLLHVFFLREAKPYRRSIGKSVWHSCSNCKGWPTENFVEADNLQFGVCPVCVQIENKHGRYTGTAR